MRYGRARPSQAVAISSIVNGMIPFRLSSPLVEIRDARLESRGVRLCLKRDDLIYAELPGNKWRKLKCNGWSRARARREYAVDLRWGVFESHQGDLRLATIWLFVERGPLRGAYFTP